MNAMQAAHERMSRTERLKLQSLRPDTSRLRVKVTFWKAPEGPRETRNNSSVFFFEGGSRQVVVAGQHLLSGADGTCEAVIYADELEALQGLVETETDTLASARAINKRNLGKHMSGALGREVFAKIDLDADPVTWPDAAEKAVSTFAGSVEAEFFKLTDRGIRPLAAVDVLEELDPPETPEAAFARQVAPAAGGLTTEDIVALGKSIGAAIAAEMRAETKGGKK